MKFVESDGMVNSLSESGSGRELAVTGCEALARAFRCHFTTFDLTTGQAISVRDTAGTPEADRAEPTNLDESRLEICREVARRGKPEFIAEHNPIVILAAPICIGDASWIAIAPFVVRASDDATIAAASRLLGLEPDAAEPLAKATVWSGNQILHIAQLALSHSESKSRFARMQAEIDDLSAHLAATYEELSLLYGLTQKLRISDSIEELGAKSLEWLAEAIPAEGFVLELLPRPQQEADAVSGSQHEANRASQLLTFGNCPVDRFQFARLLEQLDLIDNVRPMVVNPSRRQGAEATVDGVRQAVIVPLTEGDNLFGWLATFNHESGGEFGSSEASLLSSVAAILGIHAGNIELYRRQAEFLSGVVRALTSAIDAKDPYTCGHSDRVARVSVKLADRLGCDAKELETIYLSGLLHDIGKIGIDDIVLRKPGKLSEAEYEHIKLHADIGYKILKDLKQLGQILPAVRHHHEAWDGTGYPHGLAGDQIPLYARIVAVADAFDAMSSDRPYRQGMPDEKLDGIFRAGAGKQWDTKVVEAFFACREEIRRIAHQSEPEPEFAEVGQMV
jgi:HD-GYP domain-containing protein (c-di-GMP phosphodiesterase class II)